MHPPLIPSPRPPPRPPPRRLANPTPPLRRPRRNAGVTLIELVIAVAILALGSAAAWRTLDTVRRGIGGQAARALAQEVALNRAAELRLSARASGSVSAALPGLVQMGGIDWRVTLTAQETEGSLAETEIRVTATGQPGARLLVWLPRTTDQGRVP